MLDQSDKVVLAFCFNPTLSFSALDEPFFRAAFGGTLDGITRKKISQLISKFADTQREKLNHLLHGSIQSLMFDGGSDVGGKKMVIFGLMNGETALLYRIIDGDKVPSLNTEWYKSSITSIVTELEQHGTFVPSITQDNEAAPLAGSYATLKESFPHLIIIRCGPHTIELL